MQVLQTGKKLIVKKLNQSKLTNRNLQINKCIREFTAEQKKINEFKSVLDSHNYVQ
jgi:hypothetical protein